MENDKNIYWDGDLLLDGETLQVLGRVAENLVIKGCFFVDDLRQTDPYAQSGEWRMIGTKYFATKDAAKKDGIGKYK